jgi:hypothetical protein
MLILNSYDSEASYVFAVIGGWIKSQIKYAKENGKMRVNIEIRDNIDRL